MTEELQPLLDAIKAAINTPLPKLDAASFEALQTRAAEVAAGMQRRAQAGVRVHASTDSLDDKRAQVLADTVRAYTGLVQSLMTTANAQTALLTRAARALCEQAIEGIQRDAAAREAAEAEAARAAQDAFAASLPRRSGAGC